MTSKHFHSKEHGCELEEIENRNLKHKDLTTITPRKYFCKTHNVTTCHCGWEFGHHYEDNEKMNSPMVKSRYYLKKMSGLSNQEMELAQLMLEADKPMYKILQALGKGHNDVNKFFELI